MKRIPFHNAGKHGIYVGNTYVPAGGTRTVDASLLPQVEATPQAEPEDAIAALHAGKAKEIVDAVAGLGQEDAQRLLDLENAAEKPRSSVVKACELRLLDLATGYKDKGEGEGEGEGEGQGAGDSDPT